LLSCQVGRFQGGRVALVSFTYKLLGCEPASFQGPRLTGFLVARL
jgi:hypothetical protein